MKVIQFVLGLTFAALIALGCSEPETDHQHKVQQATTALSAQLTTQTPDTVEYEVQKSEEEWRKILTSKEYEILRERGTEYPYVNEYYNNKKEGVYYCAACGQPLFSSETKYKSGTGWPSYWKPIKPSVVGERVDKGWITTRTETVCARCGSHLGHVFEDGPEPTGLRYCMNSAALDFVEMDLSEVDVETLEVRNPMASN